MSVSDPVAVAREGYQFDSFEVWIRQGSLLNHGKRIRIQELPFQMLLVLLEHPGRTVTKEELGNRLWSHGTYIEVDKGLYVVAAKLRDALGDDATRPRFIKTVSGQGYRFIGEVTPILSSVEETVAAESPQEPVELAASVETPIPESRRRKPAMWVWLTLLAGLSVSICLVFWFIFSPRRPLIDSQDKVAVGGFVNKTGNPDLDKILSSAVALELQESPWLNIIPDRRFRALVQDPDADPLPQQIQACVALHGKVLLGGQILPASHGYLLMLMAWRCQDGRLLTTQKAVAESKTTILPVLDSVSQKMRAQLGEPEDSLKRFNVPLVQATTTSLSALRAFTLGEEQRTRGQESQSISDYQLAADLDPQFALAYARLGTIYYNTGEFALSQKNYQRAFQLRGRTTDRERLYITSHYYANSTGEIQRAIEAYQLWHAMYPRDMAPINNLAIEDLLIGQPENILPLARMAVQLDPVTSQPYATLIQAYLMTGDYRDLNEACAHPLDGKSDGIVFHESCFEGAFAQHDDAAMQRQVQWAHGNPRESSILNDLGMVAIYQGRIAAARQLFAGAEQNALQYKFTENAAQIYLNEALAEACLGYAQDAKTDALAALKISPDSPTVEAVAALALARVGDTARAQMEADHAAAEMPLNTIVNFSLIPSAHAAIALDKHQPAAAIRSLKEARPYDFSYLLAFAPAYLRGQAYLDNGEPKSAASEFQRVLDRRAIAPDSPYIALSTFQLGRAHQLAGDTAAASAFYRETESIWKGADPGFPPLRQLRGYEHEFSTAAAK